MHVLHMSRKLDIIIYYTGHAFTGSKNFVFSNRRNFDDDKKYTYTCLHWHHDMVMDLAFSVTGKCRINK